MPLPLPGGAVTGTELHVESPTSRAARASSGRAAASANAGVYESIHEGACVSTCGQTP